MYDERARTLLQEERVRVLRLLGGANAVGRADREAVDQDAASSDAAELLASQGADDALTAELRIGWPPSTGPSSDSVQEHSDGRSAADRPSLTTGSRPTPPRS